MRGDAHDQEVIDAMAGLPGYSEDGDGRRGYVGWGPHDDAAKTVEHKDWGSYLAGMANTDRYVLDFYFGRSHASEPCACCDESGHTPEYAELSRGFYRHGGGRWAGWGKGPLTQDEVDALVENRRIRVPRDGTRVTPDNIGSLLGPIGHDAINQWILVAARAKRMGFDRTCEECYGDGRIKVGPERLHLNVWTADPGWGTAQVEEVEEVQLSELDDVRDHMEELGRELMRERFGWATGSNMHPLPRFSSPATGWIPGQGGMNMRGRWFNEGVSYASWDDFYSEFGGGDPDLNLVADWHMVVDEDFLALHEARERGDHVQAGNGELPEAFGVDIWMTHPRKGADRAIRIRYATREQTDEIRGFLARSAHVHERHFGWVGGHYPDEAVDSNMDSPSPRMP